MKISDHVSITINGKNANPYVVSYEREDKICTGKGLFHVVLSLDCVATFVEDDFLPWRPVVLSENGVVVKQYNINSEERILPTNSLEVTAQDGSKRLEECFIEDSYTVTSPVSTKYYIQLFLDNAGVSYNFTSEGYGNLLPNDTGLGMVSTYEQVVQLLQLSAWYMYFDSNNICVIGKLSKNLSSPSASFDETDIITIHTHEDDKSLRNRAVIWGRGDSTTGTWVYADVMRITPWNYDSYDKRTIVYSSQYITNWGVAYNLATLFLDEYARLTFTKEVTIHGARSVTIGDVVYLDTRIFSGSGLVTTCSTEMSSDGLITKLIIDERCPRLLGYYGFLDYVYVGTDNNGVWRKMIDEPLPFEDFSDGLTDLCVTDLYKNNGILSCVTSNGSLFVRNEFAPAWSKVNIPPLYVTISGEGGEEVQAIASGIMMARATTQDRRSNIIHALVDNSTGDNVREYGVTNSGLWNILLSGENNYCWVVEASPYNGNIIASHQVTMSGGRGFVGYDIDNDGINDYISVAASVIGRGSHTIGETVTVTEGITLSAAIDPSDHIAVWFRIIIESLCEYGFSVTSSDIAFSSTPPTTYLELINYQTSDSPTEWTVAKHLEFTPGGPGQYKVSCDVACMGHYNGSTYGFLNPEEIVEMMVRADGTVSGELGGMYDGTHNSSSGFAFVINVVNDIIYDDNIIYTARYLVMKRNQNTFYPIQSGLYDSYRLDLSESNPLSIITSGEWGMGFIETLPSNEHHMSNSSDLVMINDFRSLTTLSGQALYYTKGKSLLDLNITNLDIIDYKNPSLVYNIDSGMLDRLETSKHILVDPYIFVSLIGDGMSYFLQKDVTTNGSFVDNTLGLPEDLINIIRLDDRV